MGEFHGNQHTDSEYNEYEYEDLVEDVAALAEELGRSPTTEDASQADGLPSIATLYKIIKDDWVSTLRDAGVEPTKNQRRSLPIDRRERMLEDLRQTNRETEGDVLRLRQYDENGSFDGSSMKVRFGSWSEACTEAGIECGTRHGERCVGPNGNQLDSRHELAVARYLDEAGIEYETHVGVGSTRWTCDFYLPNQCLWVEVDGYVAGERPNERMFTQKLGYYAFRGMDFVVVKTPEELRESLASTRTGDDTRQT
jgi:hypothetical protein